MDREWRHALPWSVLWHPVVRRLAQASYPYLLELGWIWPFMFSAGALFFTPFSALLHVNPLMWRSFGTDDPLMQYFHANAGGWNDFSNHHTLNLAAEALLCFGLAAWFSRATATRWWRWGLLATYGAVLTWSVHEGLWWLTYAAVWRPDVIVFSGFGEMLTLGLLMFTPVLGLYAPKRFLVFMLEFQVAWIVAGFPITESYKGDTALYSDVWANAWEVASWVWACAGFFILERKGLLAWMQRVKLITQHGQEDTITL